LLYIDHLRYLLNKLMLVLLRTFCDMFECAMCGRLSSVLIIWFGFELSLCTSVLCIN